MRGIEEALELVEVLIATKTGNSLSYIQKAILRESWQEQHKTYDQIAQQNSYSANYIKQGVAPKLWHLLSDALGEKVHKTNFRSVLEKRLPTLTFPGTANPLERSQAVTLEWPEGQVPLASPFYVERSPLEQVCQQEILKPRGSIRIKGLRQIGKTSLMARILAYANEQHYHTVRLSLNQADSRVFTSIDKFLWWFCANVTRQLELEPKLEQYWDQNIGSLVSCTIYFQEYLLEQVQYPMVLALDEVNQVFEYPAIARDCLALLRSWQGETKDVPVWQKLRLVLVTSTDADTSLNLAQSRLNAGLAIQLPPFTREQVQDLSHRHGLHLSSEEVTQLMTLSGGFPYLVRLALYHIVYNHVNLEQVMQTATTEAGIYSDHLHRHWWTLQQYPELAAAYQQVVKATAPVELKQMQAFRLKSMGLVHLEGNRVRVSCELYRQYFSDRPAKMITNPLPVTSLTKFNPSLT